MDNIEMIRNKIGEDRHYAKYLNFLNNTLQISPDVSKGFYANKFTSHFYTPDEINALSL